MAPSEFRAAVLAFLDQFIPRGAAPDIVDLWERLANDAATQRALDDRLPATPSDRQAFDALVEFFKGESDLRKMEVLDSRDHPDLSELLSWTLWERNIKGDEVTSDEAQWHGRLASIDRFREKKSETTAGAEFLVRSG